jgi:hypothetical protein
MTYDEIAKKNPEEYTARSKDKLVRVGPSPPSLPVIFIIIRLWLVNLCLFHNLCYRDTATLVVNHIWMLSPAWSPSSSRLSGRNKTLSLCPTRPYSDAYMLTSKIFHLRNAHTLASRSIQCTLIILELVKKKVEFHAGCSAQNLPHTKDIRM